MPCRNADKGKDFLLKPRFGIEPCQAVDKQVDALVLEFVAAAVDNEHGIGSRFLPGKGFGHLDQTGTGVFALYLESGLFGYKMVIEAVGRHNPYGLIQKRLAFVVGDFAYGGKAVGVLRGKLFEREFGPYPEAFRKFLGVIAVQLAVKRQPVAGNAPSQHGGVGREHGGDLRLVFLEVEKPRTGHPFVKMGKHPFLRKNMVFVETLNHLARTVAEQDGFDIIPLPGNGVELVIAPVLGQNLVFLGNQRTVVHHDGDRLAGDIPVADAEIDAPALGVFAPVGKEVAVFDKVAVVLVFPDIGSYGKIIFPEPLLHGGHLGAHHRVDSAHFVTNFPTYLKEIRILPICCHVLLLCDVCLFFPTEIGGHFAPFFGLPFQDGIFIRVRL